MSVNVITVNNLVKSFQIQIKNSGIRGQIEGIFSKKFKVIKAVNNISFKISKGESVGFIGPNGAGKSTTIKILTGILHSTGGQIDVLGFDPAKSRQTLSFKLGSIFGQKTQLWYHLPPKDTFDLLASIFEIDSKTYQNRLSKLIRTFAIQEVVNTPVRKLSLGQRMKCELVAALLHNPEILLLDEPTIGLDIIAKKQLRKVIKQLNETEKKTILLTSHDLSDIEDVCKRVIVINHGKIIFDGLLEDLKKNYIKRKRIRVVFESKKVPDVKLSGVTVMHQEDFAVIYEININKMNIRTFINALMKKDIVDITISDIEIEEIIEELYKKK
jgi:ABC-2 type transport system ATP-binding protein